MFSNIKKLALISRPISWVNTAFPFAATFLVIGGAPGLFFWLATFFFLIPYNFLMYGINDVFDYESDMRNPRKGGLEGAKEQKNLHPLIIKSSIILTVPFVMYLLLVGSLAANITLLLLLFFVVAYSCKGLRFKEIPIVDSFTSSIHFVGPMVYAMVVIGFQPNYWPFILAFFLWGVASHALGAVQDIIPDRQGKLASVATVFGARSTTRLVFMLYIVASLVLAFQGIGAAVIAIAGLVYAANTLPYLNSTDKTSGMVNKAWRRFIWLNLFVGFVVTLVLIIHSLSRYGI